MSSHRALLYLAISLACLFCASEANADFTPAKSVRVDAYGDPLPPGALLRLGTVRWRAQTHFVAFTPDGKTLITAEDDETIPHVVRFWDVATGKEISRFQKSNSLSGFALSPDGKTLAFNLSGERNGILFVSVPTGKEVRHFVDQAVDFDHLAYAADGRTLVAADRNGAVWFFDANTGANRGRLTEYALWGFRTALSPNGKQILLTDQHNTLTVVDVATKEEVFNKQIRPEESGWPLNASFSSDGKKSVWMGEAKNTFALWDISSGKAVLQFRGPPGLVESVLFSPERKYISSVHSSEDGGSIHLWDAATGKEIRQFLTPAHAVPALAFSPDGKRLAASVDGVLHLWDVETGKEQNRFGEHRGGVVSANFSPDGRTALTGCADGMIRVWDAHTGAVVGRIDVAGMGGRGGAYGIVFSSDCRAAAITGFHKTAELWDLNSGERRAELNGDKDNSWVVAFTPDGKTLASKDDAGKGVQLWDAKTGKNSRRITIAMNEDTLVDFAFSPDGKTLLAARNVGAFNLGAIISSGTIEISLWDATAGKELSKWPTGTVLNASGLLFSPDGALSVVSDGQQVHLWNMANHKAVAALTVAEEWPSPGLYCTAFSPNGGTLAAAGFSGDIYLWEVNTAKLRRVFRGHRGYVSSLEFSPDGTRLLSGSADTTALIWDLTGLADNTEAKTLTSDQLAALWRELADEDAGKAWDAGWRLAADPAASVPFLRKQLRLTGVDAARLGKLLAALDADAFEEREAASRELARISVFAGRALRKALKEKPSPEARRRLEELMNKLDGPITIPEQARELRCIEVLEQINTPEARAVLDEFGQMR